MKTNGPYVIYEEGEEKQRIMQNMGLVHVGKGNYKKKSQINNPKAPVFKWSGNTFVAQKKTQTTQNTPKDQEQVFGGMPKSDWESIQIKLKDKKPKPQFTSQGLDTGVAKNSAKAHSVIGDKGVPIGRTIYNQEELKKLLRGLQALGKSQGKIDGVPAAKFDLCTVQIPGTNMFCGDIPKSEEYPDGIPRAEMPQLKTLPRLKDENGRPTRAAKLIEQGYLQVDPKSGEINAQPYFDKWLSERGITKEIIEVSPDSLKSTQAELSGEKVTGMMGALEKGEENNPAYSAITAPIYVSEDGYILDGHHRWAAIVAYNELHPEKPIPMKVMRLKSNDGTKLDAIKLVELSNQFGDEFGLQRKVAGQTSGQK